MLAALKWVIDNPYAHTTIPSMTDMDQLDQNLKAMAEPFTTADEKLLARQLDYIGPLYCRMCGKCEGTCAKGLPVADITAEGNVPQSKTFLAESARVELPAKELRHYRNSLLAHRGFENKGEAINCFLEKSETNFSIQRNTGAL